MDDDDEAILEEILRSGAPRGAPRRRRRRRVPRLLVAWLAGLVVLAVVLPFVYIHVFEGSAPPPLELPVGPGGASGPVNGTWTVRSPSEAGYRVTEVLFGQHNVAVGRTSKVSGTLVIRGATVTAARFEVDVASIKSDAAGRDVVFRDSIMDTSTYPDAEFRLTKPVDMDRVPGPNSAVTERATGRLTLRGQSHVVTFALHARRDGKRIVVQASIPVHFSAWDIPNPSFAITKVGDTGTVEVLLYLTRGG